MTAKAENRQPADWSWTLLTCTSAFALSATLALVHVLWKVVPYHATVFEQMGLSLPPLTLYALVMSNWFVRLLPLLYLVGGAVGGVLVVLGLAAVAFFAVPLLKVVRVAAMASFVLGLGMAAVTIFVLYAVEQAYR